MKSLYLASLGLVVACTSPEASDTDPITVTITDDTTDTGSVPTGPFAFSDVRATLNPVYGTVIEVSWSQTAPADVLVDFEVDHGVWLRSPVRALGAGAHEELILGAPFDTSVTWRLLATAGDDEIQTDDEVTLTAPTPDQMPRAMVLSADPKGWDPQVAYVLAVITEGSSITSRGWTLLVDRQGRVVWAHRGPSRSNTMYSRPSWGADSFLIDHSSYFSRFDQGVASEIVELRIDGTLVRTIAVPGQHHPFTDRPDGSIVYSAYHFEGGGYPASDDVMTEVAPDGTRRELFSCRAWAQAVGERGWCGANTITFDADRDIYLYSLFTYETVVQIDASTLEADKWFGQSPGSYTFDPPGSAFDYQHGPLYTADGTLLLSTHSSRQSGDVELAVREYMVDDVNEALVEVWSWGVGLGVSGTQMGEVHRLGNGNTLHNYGEFARLREVTTDGDLVWDIAWEATESGGGGTHHQIGRSTPITTSLYDFAPDRG